MTLLWALGLTVGLPGAVQAKIDLVSLPKRDAVQLTIYNTADLTLVKETRRLTLRKGINRLEFGWSNTWIDPTSVSLQALVHPGEVELLDVSYPARTQGLAVWTIHSNFTGEEPVEITFFTSGIHWNAYYLSTLTRDESLLSLEGYVRVTNRSGEDYANAQSRLLVGKINLIDKIIDLARRKYPYGRPMMMMPGPPAPVRKRAMPTVGKRALRKAIAEAEMRPKEIVKEALSEYFLYTIEGTETILDGWGKRLPSFKQSGIPVVNLYRYEEERWGKGVVRFVTFLNDQAHGLGKEPLPGGLVKVFRQVDEAAHLSYIGADQTKYIPIGEKVALNLGTAKEVRVEPILMDYRTDHYLFDQKGNVAGWDEIRTYELKVSNFRSLPIKVEIWRNFPEVNWELENNGAFGRYDRVDVDTVKYTLELLPNTAKTFAYTLTLHKGRRAE